ncbi:hypothetical protein B0H11DRAFT_1975020 [Mycena galericulata]|nr:hypothetical protein B0H11DRAFT_1975020 [Mycena galericulata]
MPVFALAYGSYGDIQATIQLAIHIAVLLRRGGRPSSQCAETEKELKVLSNELDLTDSALQQTPVSQLTPFVAEQIRGEVIRCHAIMARFFTKITAPQGFFQSIWSAASEERVFAAFRMQIIERRNALGFVVGLLNSGALSAVQDRIGAVGEQVDMGNDQIREVHDGVVSIRDRVDDFRDQMRGLGNQLTQVLAVISHVPHGVYQGILFVLLPSGKPIPISLLFCTSFKAMDQIVWVYLLSESRKNLKADPSSLPVILRVGIYGYVAPDGHITPRSQFNTMIRPGILLEIRVWSPEEIRASFRQGPLYCPDIWRRKAQPFIDHKSSIRALASRLLDNWKNLKSQRKHRILETSSNGA